MNHNEGGPLRSPSFFCSRFDTPLSVWAFVLPRGGRPQGATGRRPTRRDVLRLRGGGSSRAAAVPLGRREAGLPPSLSSLPRSLSPNQDGRSACRRALEGEPGEDAAGGKPPRKGRRRARRLPLSVNDRFNRSEESRFRRRAKSCIEFEAALDWRQKGRGDGKALPSASWRECPGNESNRRNREDLRAIYYVTTASPGVRCDEAHGRRRNERVAKPLRGC